MQIELSEEHQAIQENVAKICAGFDDAYWSAREEEKTFPFEFHRAMADGGWLGITMPAHLGGAGLGVTEAAIMMHTVTSSAGGYSAASTIHLNLFGPHAVVVFGNPEQHERMLVPLIKGADKACFGVTEPDAGLDTTRITTFATKVEGGDRATGRKIWTSSAQVANKIVLLTRTTPREQWDAAVASAIAGEVRQRSLAALVDALEAAGVWVEVCNDRGEHENLHDPALLELGTVYRAQHPKFGEVRQIGPLVRLAATAPSPRRHAPLPGEQTDEVLAELGLSRDEIAGLRERKIVR